MAPPSHPENRPATPWAEDPRQRQHRTAVVETDGLLLASQPQEARIGEQEPAAPTGAQSAVCLHRASAKTISGAGELHHQHRCELGTVPDYAGVFGLRLLVRRQRPADVHISGPWRHGSRRHPCIIKALPERQVAGLPARNDAF